MKNRILEYKLKQIFKFGIFSLIIFYLMIHFIQDKDFKSPILFFTFFYGTGVGFIFTITDSPKFYSKLFLIRNTLRISLLVFLISILLILTHYIFNNFFDEFTKMGVHIFTTKSFIKSAINILIVTFFLVLFIEMEKHLGNRFIIDFFFSKYKKPIDEDRIVMFLDLKDSTTIAEKIGNKNFVEFINLCYRVMAYSTISNKAEILKYVGDEAILTWKLQEGIKNNNCINFYFDFQEKLNTYREEFENRFGFFPVFKAGVHSGMVTAAFLGTLKKQKDYSGDVMNTTARIESVCNTYNADLLVSSSLAEMLPKDNNFSYENIGELDLKGKVQKVGVSKVEKKGC